MFDAKEMCDVFLKVGDKEFGAHRLVLCASSDVFRVSKAVGIFSLMTTN